MLYWLKRVSCGRYCSRWSYLLEKKKKKNKMKKDKDYNRILIAAVIAAAGITWYVMNQKNQKTGNSSAEVVAWDVDIEEEEPSEEKGILIPDIQVW